MGVSLKPSRASSGRPEPTEEALELLDHIETLRCDGRYRFADDTLKGISETVGRTGVVSEAQARAVRNIEAGGNRETRAEKSWGRRYEGY